jgi:hypothetical protein
MCLTNYLAVGLLVTVIFIYLYITRAHEAFTTQQVLANGQRVLAAGSGIGFVGLSDGALTVDTIPEALNLKMRSVLGGILNDINAKTGKRYFLQKIDRINSQPIKKGCVGCETAGAKVDYGANAAAAVIAAATGEFTLGVRYTVDFFAHELLNQETRRFVVIFVVDKDERVNVEHINLSNAFRYPMKAFTNPTDLPDPEIIISDAALNPSGSSGPIMGMPTGTLDFSQFRAEGAGNGDSIGVYKRMDAYEASKIFINGDQEAWVPLSVHRTDTPLVPGTGSDESIARDPAVLGPMVNWPNRKHGKWWDANGVANVESDLGYGIRSGLDHAINQRPPQVYDNPTVARMARDRYDDSITMFAKNWGVHSRQTHI